MCSVKSLEQFRCTLVEWVKAQQGKQEAMSDLATAQFNHSLALLAASDAKALVEAAVFEYQVACNYFIGAKQAYQRLQCDAEKEIALAMAHRLTLDSSDPEARRYMQNAQSTRDAFVCTTAALENGLKKKTEKLRGLDSALQRLAAMEHGVTQMEQRFQDAQLLFAELDTRFQGLKKKLMQSNDFVFQLAEMFVSQTK